MIFLDSRCKMITEKVAKRIKELRAQQRISQEELAFLSGVHRTYIASLEMGKRNVSLRTLEKIVNAFNMTMHDFFDFGEDK